MKFKIKLIIASAAFAATSLINAQTLATVTVSDYFVSGGGFGSGYDFTPQSGGQPFTGYAAMVAVLNQVMSLSNVRCTAGELRNTTSQSSADERWLAAELVFRSVKQSMSLFARVFGTGNSPFQGGRMTVTYADGGTEEFYITNPQFSSAMAAGPVPGSLKAGNGVPQPHPVCG